MADFYVRQSVGNDANAGTSPAAAKATITAGAALLTAAGTDRLIVGPGTYRESVPLAISGSTTGAEHQILADPFGLYTGDAPGVCRITGSDDDASRVRAEVLAPNCSHVKVIGFYLDGGIDGVVKPNPSTVRTNFSVEDCVLDPWGGDSLVRYSNGFNCGLNLRRCLLREYANSHGFFADHASGILALRMENCWLEGISGADTNPALFGNFGAGEFDVTLRRCFVGAPRQGGSIWRQFNGTLVVDMRNCLMRMGAADWEVDGPATIVEQNNVIEGANAPSPGSGTTIGFVGESLLWAMLRGSRTFALRGKDGGTATDQPSLDIFSRTALQGTAHDIGPAESQDYPTRDTGTFRLLSPSMATLAGRRFLHVSTWLVKGGVSNAFSVWVRYNSSYSDTPRPRMIIKANPLIGLAADTTVEATTASLNAFAAMTTTVTPSADGAVDVWLETYSVLAGAQAWFDDMLGPSFS